MGGVFHKDATDNHRIESWVYATLAARNAAILQPSDVGRLCYVIETSLYYRLLDNDPLLWQSIIGDTGSVDLSGYYTKTESDARFAPIGGGGSTYNPNGYTKPLSTGWTEVNKSTGTITYGDSLDMILPSHANFDFRGVSRANPAGDFTLTACLQTTLGWQNPSFAGIGYTISDGTRFLIGPYDDATNIYLNTFALNNGGGIGASYNNITGNRLAIMVGQDVWLRVVRTGTTISLQYSRDGLRFLELKQHTGTAATNVVAGGGTSEGNGFSVRLLSWSGA